MPPQWFAVEVRFPLMPRPNPPLAFTGTIVLPDRLLENGVVVCRNGVIDRVGPAAEIAIPPDAARVDASGGFIAPGYVDIHVHGGAGADFMDGTPEAVITATRAHARHGTTSIFPTTTTGSRPQITAMLQACQIAQREWRPDNGARIAGVHFYGPYFAEDKVGCHSREGRRDPDPAEYQNVLSMGLIRVATCAAELPGSEAFYRAAFGHGCLVTCGHSNSTWTEMDRAYRAGMRHVDHFWCAMSSVPSLIHNSWPCIPSSAEKNNLFCDAAMIPSGDIPLVKNFTRVVPLLIHCHL